MGLWNVVLATATAIVHTSGICLVTGQCVLKLRLACMQTRVIEG